MSGAPLRIGLWGLGAHAQRNLIPAFAKSERTRLVALHTRNPEALASVAAGTGALASPDVEDLLQAPDVDAIYIATPTGLHPSAIIRVLDAGKHAWCEKPMTGSFEQTSAVLELAIGSDLVALEADMFVHHPQFKTIQSTLASRELGSVRSVSGRFGFPHRDESDFRYSRDLGGGAALDAGFYPLTAALELLGHDLRFSGSLLQTDPGFEVDTGGSALLVTDRQAAYLDWGFGRSYRSELEVWCENGTLYADRAYAKPADLETEVVIRHQSGSVETVPVPAANHFELMLDDFAAVTNGEHQYRSEMILARARLLTAISRS